MSNLCIHLTDDALIEKIKKSAQRTQNGKPKLKEFVTNVLEEYFNNRINSLKAMGINELAEYALQLEKEIDAYGGNK